MLQHVSRATVVIATYHTMCAYSQDSVAGQVERKSGLKCFSDQIQAFLQLLQHSLSLEGHWLYMMWLLMHNIMHTTCRNVQFLASVCYISCQGAVVLMMCCCVTGMAEARCRVYSTAVPAPFSSQGPAQARSYALILTQFHFQLGSFVAGQQTVCCLKRNICSCKQKLQHTLAN